MSRGLWRCPVQCAMRCGPAGAAAVLRRAAATWPGGVQWFAALLTGCGAFGVRPRFRRLPGRPEQLLGRAAGRPTVGDHPTGQLGARGGHVARRDRRDGLSEQHTHLGDVAVAHPAQQLRGRQSGCIDTGLRVAGVGTEGFDLGDRRPGCRRRLRTPPRQPGQRDRHRGVAAGEPQLLEPQRCTDPVLPQGGRLAHQRLSVGPCCQDTRHVGRSHSTETRTWASSDSTVAHTLAPSDRFNPRRQSTRNEICRRV